jgi:hypothetical protein
MQGMTENASSTFRRGNAQKPKGGGTLGRFGEGMRFASHHFVRVGRRSIRLSGD